MDYIIWEVPPVHDEPSKIVADFDDEATAYRMALQFQQSNFSCLYEVEEIDTTAGNLRMP